MKSLESKYWALYRLLLVLVLTLATNSIAAQNLIKSATDWTDTVVTHLL
jgi:hypothetical protein